MISILFITAVEIISYFVVVIKDVFIVHRGEHERLFICLTMESL